MSTVWSGEWTRFPGFANISLLCIDIDSRLGRGFIRGGVGGRATKSATWLPSLFSVPSTSMCIFSYPARRISRAGVGTESCETAVSFIGGVRYIAGSTEGEGMDGGVEGTVNLRTFSSVLLLIFFLVSSSSPSKSTSLRFMVRDVVSVAVVHMLPEISPSADADAICCRAAIERVATDKEPLERKEDEEEEDDEDDDPAVVVRERR